jgi:Tfp pilus assembly protein PilF
MATTAEGDDATRAFAAGLVLLAVACLATYARSLGNGFIDLDDRLYLELVGRHDVADFFSGFIYFNYMPITLLSFELEHALVGDAPFLYHLDNALLHAAVTVLAALTLRALGQPLLVCWLVAALFGLHPMRVESVAWLAERKGLLCTGFSLGALLAWARYARASGRTARVGGYLAATFLLVLALGSKSMAVTVPLLFLVIDWHAGRPLGIRILLEKLPLLALSIVFGLLNVAAQRPDIHADSFNAGLSLLERLGLAAKALAFYVGRSVAPFGLSGYYEVGFAEVGALTWLLAAAAAALVVAVAIRHPALRRDAVLGAALFLIPLALVLRIIPFGGYSGWHDRYLYLPSIGLFLLLTLPLRGAPAWPRALRFTAAAIALLGLGLLATLSDRRAAVWQGPESFWQDVLRKVPGSPTAHLMLGRQLARSGQVQPALAQFRQALRGNPECGPCYGSIALVELHRGRRDAAREALERAVAVAPENVPTLVMAAQTHVAMEEPDEAVPLLESALRIRPSFADGWLLLGTAYTDAGRLEQATSLFRRLVAEQPESGAARLGLGRALLRAGRPRQALEHLERAAALGQPAAFGLVERARREASTG